MKTNKLYLDNILEGIARVQTYVKGMTAEQLRVNAVTRDAVILRVALIGEAVNHLPNSLTAKYPVIPWSEIVAMRNLLIHEYEGIEDQRMWKVVSEDLKPLKHTVETMLLDEEKKV